MPSKGETIVAATAIAFSGQIGSGKSTLSRAVAETLGYSWLSFGEQVRAVARQRGHPETREHLQAIGESLVNTDLEGFCSSVLSQATPDEGGLVIDGIRHVEVMDCLRRLVVPRRLLLVFVETDAGTRHLRHAARSEGDRSLDCYERHSTEQQVTSALQGRADLVVSGSDDLSDVVRQVCEWVRVRLEPRHNPTTSRRS